jgi:hypothetical protein
MMMTDRAVPCRDNARRSRSSANKANAEQLMTRCISVHQCLSAVRFWSLLANISVHKRFKETALRAVNPLFPPALSPPSTPGGERGPSGERR